MEKEDGMKRNDSDEEIELKIQHSMTSLHPFRNVYRMTHIILQSKLIILLLNVFTLHDSSSTSYWVSIEHVS